MHIPLGRSIVLALLAPAAALAGPAGRKHQMSFSAPAGQWDHAMPTGNGRVGALVFGDVARETIIVNHDSLFIRSAKPKLPDVSMHLPQMRRMIAEGRYREAEKFFQGKIMATYDYRGPDSMHPAFNITVDMPAAKSGDDVRRVVDFETGQTIITWRAGDVTYHRELFVSRKDQVLVMRIRASRPGRVHCSVGLLPTALKRSELGNGKDVRVPRFPLDRLKAKIRLKEVPITFNLTAKGELLTLLGRYDVGGSYKMIGGEYGGLARVTVKGGRAETAEFQVRAKGADEVLVICELFANEPSGPAVKRLRTRLEALPTDYGKLLRRHAAVHRELFLRATLDLHGDEKYRSMTNRQLLAEARRSRGGRALMERLFDFGRFALICSSAPQGMPSNLKGIWNGVYGPAWSADYHNDVNVQMTYYQALPGNMAEVTLSYFDYYESMVGDFRTNARNLFGCRGIVAPICQTTHGLDYGGAFSWWTAGAGWLAQLFHDYWLYTGDRRFLQKRVVPFMKEVALFYEDFLIEGPDGRYVFSPSMSPENHPANVRSLCTVSATMDVAVARELLTNLCSACELLGIEEDGVKRWRKMLAKLPEYRINKAGALAEWIHPALKDNYGHRHLSHMYPVYPGWEITRERNAKLLEACRIALDLKKGPSQCNFTFPLIASTYARLADGDQALKSAEGLARVGYLQPNLLTLVGRSWPTTQFESASGTTAAVLDMLVYSEPGLIKLLPALAKKWPAGKAAGLRCRGVVEVDLQWDMPKRRIDAVLRSQDAQTLTLKCPAPILSVEPSAAGVTVNPSPYGAAYRRLTLPAGKKVALSIRLK